jgi:tetratricopeptide (TPR) repeat protein
MESGNPKTVFLSYAHADAGLVRDLAKALRPLEEEGLISVWQDRRIEAGLDWRQEITERLSKSELIVLLLSAEYLASDYCWGLEMKAALDRYSQGKSHLVPVILRPCDWRSTPLARLQVLPRDGKPVTQWSSPAAALVDVVRGLREKLARSPEPHQASVDAVAPPVEVKDCPGIWSVPLARDVGFVGRRTELAELHETLKRAESFGRPIIMTGLAGVGKTALAVEYAYRFGHNYSAIWWLRTDRPETLASDLASFASALGLTGDLEPDQRHAVDLAREWLTQHRGWLLICDDIQNAEMLESLPTATTGRILGTSRVLSWRSRVELFPLLPLAPSDARLLLSGSGVQDGPVIEELAAALGGHPLALRLAAAQLHHFGHRPSDLIAQLEDGVSSQHKTASVGAVVRALLDDLPKAAGHAHGVLSICSFLAPAPFPVETLIEQLRLLEKDSKKEDLESSLSAAVSSLVMLGLVERSGAAVVFHPLVQELVRTTLAHEACQRWAAAALYVVTGAFPEVPSESSSWRMCSDLLPHAYTTLEHAETYGVGLDALVVLLRRVGLYLEAKGEFADAQRSFLHALRASERTRWKGTLICALLYQHLGGVSESLGDLQAAADNYNRALSISESAPDRDPVAVIHLLEALARVLTARGEMASSDDLVQRAVQMAVATLGPDHELVGRLLAQRSDLLRRRGRFAEAQQALERAIHIAETSTGGSHSLLRYWNSLGVLLGDRGDFVAAKRCFERVVHAAREEGDQASLATVINNLGRTFQESGSMDEAIRCYHESLSINQGLKDRDPQSMGLALKNLGEAYSKKGDYTAARGFLERALQILEGALGPTHSICRTISDDLVRTGERSK